MKIPAYHRVRFRNGTTLDGGGVRDCEGEIILTAEAGIGNQQHEVRIQMMRGYADWIAPQNKPKSFAIAGVDSRSKTWLILFDYDCHEKHIDDLGLITKEEALTHPNPLIQQYGLELCSTDT